VQVVYTGVTIREPLFIDVVVEDKVLVEVWPRRKPFNLDYFVSLSVLPTVLFTPYTPEVSQVNLAHN
jgi:hypothetical protein